MFTHGSTIAKLVTGLALTIATTCGAAAQIWQASDGGRNTEIGRGGGKLLAAGNGFISAGTTTSAVPGNNDVYVVESNLNGGVIWQFAYDFGGTSDEGYDIVELAGGGFAITGTTTAGGGGTDAFILTINAAGGAPLVQTFGAAGNDAGLDILQSAVNGDLVVAGFATNTLGNQDGLLIRIPLPALPCAAAPTFVNTYAPPIGGGNDYFRGLWEATVGGPGVAVGDLIMCGGTNSFAGTTDALLMRTTALGVPIWTNITGGPLASTENFNSVIQLTVGGQVGNIVAAGATTVPAPSSLYVAKFNGATGAQIPPDVAGGPAGSFTEIFSVRENLVNNPGNLILAGHTNPGIFGGDDAYAVEMTAVWGCPVGKVWSMEYGGAATDQFLSGIEANTPCKPGYFFDGFTTSPALLPPLDPQNMYLVKTNNVGNSGCNEGAPLDGCVTPGYPTTFVGMPPLGLTWGVCKTALIRNVQGNFLLCLTLCTVTGPNRNSQDNDGVAGVASDDATATANAYPNPVVAGNSFTVQYTVDKTQTAEASVLVSDMAGKVVFEQKVDAGNGTGTVSISTSGWPVGTYLVKLGSGSASQTKRIVVMDK